MNHFMCYGEYPLPCLVSGTIVRTCLAITRFLKDFKKSMALLLHGDWYGSHRHIHRRRFVEDFSLETSPSDPEKNKSQISDITRKEEII